MAKLLCVYCASSDRIDPKYAAAAAELGHEMVRRGWGLVYGGGKTGLMGAVARAVKKSGGHVVGVIPEFMKVRELAYDEADELVTVVTLRERKLLMETRADAFVALPGGFGTLDELLEQLTWSQLGLHAKPIGLLDVEEYWRPLIAVARHATAEGFVREADLGAIAVATDAVGLLDRLERSTREARPRPKWSRPEP